MIIKNDHLKWILSTFKNMFNSLSHRFNVLFKINITKFFLDYLKFKKFLRKQKIERYVGDVENSKICITAIPWMGSAVPWYAISVALLLYKSGKNVFILFDDMPFGKDHLFYKVQSNLIFKVLTKLPIKLVKLSDYENTSYPIDDVKHLSKLNSLHFSHGETNHALRQSYERIIEEQLSSTYSKLANLYEIEDFTQIILPGGMWGPSGVFTLLAQKYNIQLTTYDGDDSTIFMSIFGVAAQLKDIPYSFDKLLNDSKEKKFAVMKGHEQLQKRRQGKEIFAYFPNPSSLSEFKNDYFLMLLNSVWDTAALGLHTVYDSMIDWIFDSIEWVLKNTHKTILIRQHPAERDKYLDNTDSYEKRIRDQFGCNERILFIHADQNVNTYDLIENASCILGFSSTVIVESVVLGKPAIIVSDTYYANLDIVYSAKNKKEYYEYLEKASNNQLDITEEMRERACISNYITQSCNRYNTKFTPTRNSFLKWSKLTLEELEKDYLPLQAILKNIPLSTLQHERCLNDK